MDYLFAHDQRMIFCMSCFASLLGDNIYQYIYMHMYAHTCVCACMYSIFRHMCDCGSVRRYWYFEELTLPIKEYLWGASTKHQERSCLYQLLLLRPMTRVSTRLVDHYQDTSSVLWLSLSCWCLFWHQKRSTMRIHILFKFSPDYATDVLEMSFFPRKNL